jgi:Squalene-hopene cyclase C-terminal domain/Prenyltransferase and squalene oxidase repeat
LNVIMFNSLTMRILFALALVFLSVVLVSSQQSSEATAEEKAISFLAREVPAWSKNNGCFSCHNDGDAARALYAASRKGYAVPQGALNATTAWVTQPDKWEENKGDPGFSDKTLSSVQFASSLLAAFEAGQVRDRQPLEVAARKLIAEQSADGAWRIDPDSVLGSPTTWGTTLTTSMAMKVLQREGSDKSIEAYGKAQRWLSRVEPNSVFTAATLILAGNSYQSTQRQRTRALNLLRVGQTSDGGWGPYTKTPPEIFDTAMALLALTEVSKEPGVKDLIGRGRKFLISQQRTDGSWVETTRPSAGESYAQRLSTTGWATLALLMTRTEPH